MARRNNNDLLIPHARHALDQLKVAVSREVGWDAATEQDLQQRIDRAKFEVASELNVPLKRGYNGDLPSRDAGAVGGRLGGNLGGQMVRRMIAAAEQALAQNQQR